jgi:hypothetical protein
MYRGGESNGLETLVVFSIGMGTAGLAYILTGRAPAVAGKILGAVSAVVVLGAAAAAVYWSKIVPLAVFGFLTAGLYLTFLSGLLVLTLAFVPRASTRHRVHLFAFWLMTAVGYVSLYRSVLMFLIFPGLAGLAYFLPSAKPIINSQKTSRLLAAIPAALMLIAAAAIGVAYGPSLFEAGERLILIVCGALMIFGALAAVGSHFRIKGLIVSIGLLSLAVSIMGIMMVGTAPMWPLVPVTVLLMASGFSMQPRETGASIGGV